MRVTASPSTEADMYRLLASAFEAKHPGVSVKIDASQPDCNALIQATLRDSLTGQLADISIQDNNTLRFYVDRGMASISLTPSMPRSPPRAIAIGRVARTLSHRVYGLRLVWSRM